MTDTTFTDAQLTEWAGRGPWRHQVMHTGGFDIFDPSNRDIVTVYGGGVGLESCKIHAALIAAAPALAAELKKAREEVVELRGMLLSLGNACALADKAEELSDRISGELYSRCIQAGLGLRQALKGQTND